jgi:hypothetical protein
MYNKTLLRLFLALTLVLILSGGVPTARDTYAQEPAPQRPARPQGVVGTAFTYQGILKKDGTPVTGDCNFEFRLYDSDKPLAIQIGSTIFVPLHVDNGLFDVTLDFGGDAFDGNARWLDIKVGCGALERPVELGRQALTPTPYALYALNAQWDGLPYEGVVVVAKTGGDYSSVQAAIDSISGASAASPYLVWIAPGVYDEQVTMASYVHLQGAGQEATIVANSAATTLYLAAHASLRDLTVTNGGSGNFNYAIQAQDGVTGTLVSEVTARGEGTGLWSCGVALEGSGTRVTLSDVTVSGEGGSGFNCGLKNAGGATVSLLGGSFTAIGGDTGTYGLHNDGTDTALEATDVLVLAEDADGGRGLYNGATATLHGGLFASRVAGIARGIHNNGSAAVLEARSITAEGLGATVSGRGLHNANGASATLYGGSFTGGGGSNGAFGIYNINSGTELNATGIHAVAADGNQDIGLECAINASGNATLSVLEGIDHSAKRSSGALTITNSSLVGGDVFDVTGDTTCVGVVHATTFYTSTCP